MLKKLLKLSQKVLEIYPELDSKIERFSNLSNLSCVAGCRICCNSPSNKIEATVLEFLPLAIHMWHTKVAEEFLLKLENIDENSPCVLLEPDPSIKPEGGCKYYSYRPIVCRAFGFSAIRKNDSIDPIICKHIKQKEPEILERVKLHINQIPIASDYKMKVLLLDPYLGTQNFPINIALKYALEYIGYRWFLSPKKAA